MTFNDVDATCENCREGHHWAYCKYSGGSATSCLGRREAWDESVAPIVAERDALRRERDALCWAVVAAHASMVGRRDDTDYLRSRETRATYNAASLVVADALRSAGLLGGET